jgi:polygalacturonase
MTIPYPVLGLDNSIVTSTGSSTARTLAARFADTINVLDWLTAGQPDGTTDNTSQIQAAITWL